MSLLICSNIIFQQRERERELVKLTNTLLFCLLKHTRGILLMTLKAGTIILS